MSFALLVGECGLSLAWSASFQVVSGAHKNKRRTKYYRLTSFQVESRRRRVAT
jgi:hypothetical protein